MFALYRFTKNQQDYINILSQFIVSSFVILIIAIVIALIFKDIKKNKYLNSGIQVVDKMEGKEFEKFLSAHFENLGY